MVFSAIPNWQKTGDMCRLSNLANHLSCMQVSKKEAEMHQGRRRIVEDWGNRQTRASTVLHGKVGNDPWTMSARRRCVGSHAMMLRASNGSRA
jgi:hypothetical protein